MHGLAEGLSTVWQFGVKLVRSPLDGDVEVARKPIDPVQGDIAAGSDVVGIYADRDGVLVHGH